MKRLVLLALLASACRIGDVTFTPLGGGDDTDDAAVNPDDSAITLVDAPSNLQPLRRAFLADFSGAFFILNKAVANGDLTFGAGPITPGGSLIELVAYKNHLYTGGTNGGAGEVRDLTVNNLTVAGNAPVPVPGCGEVRHMKLHPSGSKLLVTCNNNRAYLFDVDAQIGTLGSFSQVLSGAANEMTPEWSADGACMFLSDNGAPLNQAVTSYRFDQLFGFLQMSQLPGPGHAKDFAVHPGGAYLYAASLTQVQAFSIMSGCSLVPIGNPISTGLQNGFGVAVDPQGGRLFVLGEQIVPYSIAGDGHLTLIPGAQGIQGPHLDGVFDPALPNTMYTLTPGSNGVTRTNINMTSGTLTSSPGYSAPAFTSTTAFVMVP